MTSEIKAIETKYKGYRFRSRLEARWAVFFDALEEPWEYEKEGFDLGEAGYYLPDFWLPRVNAWVEVKGQGIELEGDAARKILAFVKQSEYPLIGLIGQIGTHRCAITRPQLRKLGPIVDHLFDSNSPYFSKAIERCPFCWDNHVTVNGTTTVDGQTIGCLSLRMIGQCGHRWFLDLHSDEQGSITIGQIGIPKDHNIDFSLLLAGSRDRYDAAVEAARSARFEYGESGTGRAL